MNGSEVRKMWSVGSVYVVPRMDREVALQWGDGGRHTACGNLKACIVENEK